MDFEKRRAFTLVELLMALALMTITISLAVPSMAELYRKQQLAGYQEALMRLIVQSRQHALVHRSRITLCALDSQGRCVSLKTGVLSVYTDSNGNRVLDVGETLLYTLPIPSHIRAHWVGTSPIHSLHFSGQGTTRLSNGTFTLCHKTELRRHALLKINAQGRVRAERHEEVCPLG